MESKLSPCRFLVLAASFVAAAGAAAQDFARTPLPPSYPLIGHWKAEYPGSKCVEEFEIRRVGTRTTRSAQERSESEFRMSLGHVGDDFYKWEDKIIETNGKPGCSGFATQVGQMSVKYVRLHPDGGRFLLCVQPDMGSCIAEFFQRKP